MHPRARVEVRGILIYSLIPKLQDSQELKFLQYKSLHFLTS